MEASGSDDLACFRNFLETLLLDSTLDEARAHRRESFSTWTWAPEVLECLDRGIADPPGNLVELLEMEGSVFLVHELPGQRPVQQSFDDRLRWLADLRRRLGEIRTEEL